MSGTEPPSARDRARGKARGKARGSGGQPKRGSLLWGAVIAAVAVLVALVALVALTDDGTSGETADTGARVTPTAEEPGPGSTDTADRTPTSPPSASSGPSDRTPSTQPTAEPPPATPGWQADLASLVVAPEGPREGYDRELFKHWIDADGDGCNTRCEVLERQRSASLPGLGAGGWLSIYDGYSTDDPSELDIDHVVALGEAWDSGASVWDATRREAFANDLDSPQLIAVTAATNRSKSDRDPASWQPPNRSAWCEWGAAWIGVKAKWGLSADRAEVDALTNIMRGCP